ncbi:TOMM precursor leader peptide-binding protein [Demetria terragena]|uniref:TOMM precursor leader peptide-binding protein n=1 Tax=Demetria terragena TaxID=63959 RepID=UPI00037EB3BD|nr:TOMM precursor leader peptide-binding protein [Demetria terragena]
MSTLRFRSSAQIDVVHGTLFMTNDEQTFIIEDKNTARVAELIDGTRSMPDIVKELSGEMAFDQVFVQLARLRKSGHVVETPDAGTPESAYAETYGATDRLLGEAAYHVTVLDRTESPFAGALVDCLSPYSGISVHSVMSVDALDTTDLVVVVVRDYLDDDLQSVNKQMLSRSQPWLLVKPDGREMWVGPRFIPGETGCWESAAERISANRHAARYLSRYKGGRARVKPAGRAPGAVAASAGLVANEITALALGAPGELAGAMRSVDMKRFETRTHVLVNNLQHSTDDPAALRPTSQVELGSEKAQYIEDNGYRVCTPKETYDRLEHHISPILGAISHLETLNTDEEGITYSFVAGHNFGVAGHNMGLLRNNMRGQSGGKGRTEIQAKVSGMCEAIERYSGVWSEGLPEVRSSYNALTTRALDPAGYLCYSPAQYAMRKVWNADPKNRLQVIPEVFDRDRQVDWTPARSLTTGEEVMVPSGLVWFGHPDLEVPGQRYAITDSNGGAAGNTLDEAVLQAMCEVYERDAVALWWFNRSPRPGVDLDAIESPYLQQMIDFYATMDREIWVLDLSNDLGVSTFAAFSRRKHEVEDIMVGFGAHPDPNIAFYRSLTELNQFLPFVRARDEDGNTVYGTEDEATLDWCKTRTMAKDSWVAPATDLPLTQLDSIERQLPSTMGDLVRYLVDDLAAAGMETLVVNQTRPDIELAVAKVFVPGMRHFWRRTGPGRIFDVPVKLGWRSEPMREEDVNPIGVFF